VEDDLETAPNGIFREESVEYESSPSPTQEQPQRSQFDSNDNSLRDIVDQQDFLTGYGGVHTHTRTLYIRTHMYCLIVSQLRFKTLPHPNL